MTRIMSVAAVIAAAAAVLPGCSSDDEPAKKPRKQPAPLHTTVNIKDSQYRPKVAKVLVGGTVTWINRDVERFHTAQTQSVEAPSRPWDDQGDFDTRTLSWHEPYTVTFHRTGTFEYFCSFSPETMKGTVEVVDRIPPPGAGKIPGT